MQSALIATTILCLAAPAEAADQPITGSDAVGSVYTKILGQLPPMVSKAISVQHDGKITRVTFDIDQLGQSLSSMGVKLSAKPLTLIYEPQADGTIHQSTEAPTDVTLDIDWPTAPEQHGSFTYKGITFEGNIDPVLAFYRSMTLSMSSIAGDITQEATGTTASVTTGPSSVKLIAGEDGPNLVNINQTQTLTGFVEHMHIDPSTAAVPNSNPPMDVDLKIPEIQTGLIIDGWKSIAVRDFAAFLLENHTQSAIAANQVEFKQHIHELVPLLMSAKLSGEGHHVLFQTPFGQGGAGTFAIDMELDTRTPSSLSLGERFSDINVDSVFMPVWSKSLVPRAIDLEFGVNGFDVGGLLTKFVEAVDKHDFNDPKPDTTNFQQIGKEAFLPNGGVHIDLKPSSIASPVYTISWQGRIDTHEQQASTHIDVQASGVDDLIKILTQVRDKGGPEAVIGLYAAKALAKPGPNGSLVWAIDMDSAAGTFLVNGKQVGPKR